MKFIKNKSFKPPEKKRKYLIYESGTSKFYIYNTKNRKYLGRDKKETNGNDSTDPTWLGWFTTRQEAENLLKSMGESY